MFQLDHGRGANQRFHGFHGLVGHGINHFVSGFQAGRGHGTNQSDLGFHDGSGSWVRWVSSLPWTWHKSELSRVSRGAWFRVTRLVGFITKLDIVSLGFT